MEYKPIKRLIIVKDSFIRDETELKLNAMLLMQYMIYLNEYRTFVDWSEVEEVIVNDFINLDSFIHQVSWSLSIRSYRIIIICYQSLKANKIFTPISEQNFKALAPSMSNNHIWCIEVILQSCRIFYSNFIGVEIYWVLSGDAKQLYNPNRDLIS